MGSNDCSRAHVYRQIAALHVASLDQGFLATLGVRFLELMYRAIDDAPGGVLIYEEVGGSVVGFVAGAVGMKPIYIHMLRHPVALVLALLPAMLSPRKLFKILEILRYGGSVDTQGLPDAELLSIAIAPGHRRAGIAVHLYRQLGGRFASKGQAAFRITVGDSLGGAHAFYRRMGARDVARIEVHRGAVSTIYVQDIARLAST